MTYDIYKAPPRDVCDFFLVTLPEIDEHEEHEQPTFARRLLEVFDGSTSNFHINRIMSHFPWLAQAGLLESRTHYDPNRGGNRLLVRRAKLLGRCKHALIDAEDMYTNGGVSTPPIAEPATQEAADIPDKPKKKKKKKKKKKCCDNPHIVRGKKTGKRRCKNCGKKFKPKPPKE